MKKVAVVGGYVLNKALGFLKKEDIQLALYFPKNSLVAVGEEYQIPETMYKNHKSSSMTTSAVSLDFSGKLAEVVKKDSIDIVFLDCTAEIYDYINVDGCKFVLASDYLNTVLDTDGFTNIQKVDRNDSASWSAWQQGVKYFIDHCNAEVVVCRVFYPEFYIEDGVRKLYSERILAAIHDYNCILLNCYEYLEKNFGLQSIHFDLDFFHSKVPEKDGKNYFSFPEESLRNMAHKIVVSDPRFSLQKTINERVDSIFGALGSFLDDGDVPSIFELYKVGNEYLQSGNTFAAKKCERLIMLLRNSSVPLSVKMGVVLFGYGGIGVIVHGNCILGDYVNIGANVTLGGGKTNPVTKRQVPTIEDRVYIGAGAKIVGGITIGNNSIIGVNSVVTRDIPPFSVVAGNPGVVIASITSKNYQKYTSYLYKSLSGSDALRIMIAAGMREEE